MRRQHVNVIPDDIKALFEIADIAKVFEYLETTFHVSKNWSMRYKKELKEVHRSVSEQEFFCQFIHEHIEPSINVITTRQDTLFAIIRYLLKDKIEDRRKGYQENFYNKR